MLNREKTLTSPKTPPAETGASTDQTVELPAKIERDKAGRTRWKHYRQNNKLHRNDGPAAIEYDGSGRVSSESYYQNGQLYRDDGPAMIWYNQTGQTTEKTYYQNGQLQPLNDLRDG